LSRNVKDDEEKHLMDAKAFMTTLLVSDFPDCSGWKERCLAVKNMLAKYDNTEGSTAEEKQVYEMVEDIKKAIEK